MKKLSKVLLALMFSALGMSGASAAVFNLYDWATYQDGTVISQPGMPVIPSASSILSLSFNSSGAHTAIAFVDAEIDEPTNTFFNEYGTAPVAAAAGQSWEIDEPEYVFGDIWTNFNNGALDNSNAVPVGSEDDVSMALGWDFILNAGDIAVARFFLDDVLPSSFSGFYLTHTDADSDATLYFWSTLTITPGGQAPEPATLALLGVALAGMLVVRKLPVKG